MLNLKAGGPFDLTIASVVSVLGTNIFLITRYALFCLVISEKLQMHI